MTEEFYGKNLFGEQIDFGLEVPEAKESPATKKEFNIFALTDAIAGRDKRGAWVIYEKALASGMVADEIFYRIFWGIKSLLLTAKAPSAEVAGLNPFVYKKSKAFLKNWQTEELESLLEELVSGLHEARRGVFNLETFLEKLILSI